jgi:hypothetical protein
MPLAKAVSRQHSAKPKPFTTKDTKEHKGFPLNPAN